MTEISPFPDLDSGFRAQVLRRSPDARAWLDGLPRVWAQLSQRWGLDAVDEARTGMTSIVIPVQERRSGRRVVVKLVSPAASAEDEATALRAFNGQGAVALLNADNDSQTLLLEWLDGSPLSQMSDRDRAMRIAGEITGQLTTVAAPSNAPTLAAQATAWLGHLHHQHETAHGAGNALPNEVFDLAVGVVNGLASQPAPNLTHGDLSLFNILYSSRGWVAIDPLLVAGCGEWEAHTVVRTHLPEIVSAQQPAAAVERWTRQFTEAAELDHGWAISLSFARFVGSYYWESQNGGDPENIRALRDVTSAMAKSLTK